MARADTSRSRPQRRPTPALLAVAVVLAAYEAGTSKPTWRNPAAGMARYFGFLAANGYELSELEQPATAIGRPVDLGCSAEGRRARYGKDVVDPLSVSVSAPDGRRSRRAAARRRRAVAARAARRDELRVALGHWLTPARVDALGARVAAYVATARRAGRQPTWGELLTGTAVLDTVPFAAPADFNAAARQQWRNVKFTAVMEGCRRRGWITYGKHPISTGRRWDQADH